MTILSKNIFFSRLGSLAPILLLLLTCILLRKKKIFLLVFLSGFVINNLLNIILKLTIKEPRPQDETRLFHLEVNNDKLILFDKFGMPSSHAQNCFFCLSFTFCVLNTTLSNWIILLYVIISFISVCQRYIYNKHTILQLIVGSLIGILVGYVTFFSGNKLIKGRMSLKEDDYCLV